MELSPQVLKQQKYSGEEERELYRRREDFARAALELLGIDVVPAGNGTLSSEVFEGFHHDQEDRFDFLCPELGIRFEVTGTSWTRRMSAERFDPGWKEEGRRKPSPKKAVMPILKVKVDDAYAQGIQDVLYFVSVAEGQGEWRFMPCNVVRGFSCGFYASREKPYHLIPWDKWRTPAWMAERIAKMRLRRADE